VPPTASAEMRTDIPSSINSTSLHSPEPITNATAPLNVDPEGGEPSEGAAPPEDDDSSGGAFDPVTGEINWDCPCLGGMAHGPCGPQFRAAFSCFVFSEKEPKGIDCVEKFKGMQDCFREHPDVYAEGASSCYTLEKDDRLLITFGIAEIMDDDEDAPDSPDSPSEVQEGTAPSIKTTQDGLPQTQLS
jgi:hypothetical protein